MHYGLQVSQSFEEGVHDPTKKVWDEIEDEYKCEELMTWFVVKGQDLSENEKVPYSFYRNVRVGGSLKIKEDMLASHHDSAEGPRYYDRSTCRTHVMFTVDLSKVSSNLQKFRGKNGKDYYKIQFQIQATFRSAEIEYEWTLKETGELHGKAKARYVAY
ncbi:MAG: hypothetical protein M1839_000988 [Geoglossum umbratile]|nr:MAG: hypothetical protein M1839_000988 [Geoglossum umbratile]